MKHTIEHPTTHHDSNLETEDNVNFTAKISADDDIVILEPKQPDNLSRRARKKFSENKTTVKLMLFDNDFLARANEIPYPENDELERSTSLKMALSGFITLLFK